MKNNMAKVMQAKGITEEQLSLLTGIRQNAINPIKNSKRVPKVDTALRIARALKVPVERIWSLSDRNAA